MVETCTLDFHSEAGYRLSETAKDFSSSHQATSGVRKPERSGLPPQSHLTGLGDGAATTKRRNADWAKARVGRAAVEESWIASNDEDYGDQDHTTAMSLQDLEVRVTHTYMSWLMYMSWHTSYMSWHTCMYMS